MGIEIRPPGADDVTAMFAADARAFGSWFTPDEVEEQLPTMDLGRFRIAIDGAGIVGAIGSYAFDVTLPGGTTVPMGGVTWVAVAATHRRQGLLRRLMAACHDDIDARGEPVAMLSASESGIYERFGYGAASQLWVTSIERRRAQLRPELTVEPSSVRYVDGDIAGEHVVRTWERYRRNRPGELTRSDVLQRFLFGHRAKAQDGFAPAVYLAHDDGYAVYRVEAHWNDGNPAHRMEIAELVALTPDAHLALWHTLLGIDLVATITSRQLAFDDPLPYLLTDPRVVRTTALNDGLWVNIRDVPICFGARTYRATDRLVVEVDGARFAIDGSPEGADVKRVRTRPDLVATPDALGALLLGGVSPTRLARGRRLTARDDDTLRRADLFFPTETAPGTQTFF